MCCLATTYCSVLKTEIGRPAVRSYCMVNLSVREIPRPHGDAPSCQTGPAAYGSHAAEAYTSTCIRSLISGTRRPLRRSNTPNFRSTLPCTATRPQ
ncbi:hypothetical protein PYCCODRAFT_1105276 [Trametes coccinea BRFM310]|uniref:Uncharacterized protein n=1 Tax=Trametes coccinea (strain BRFM310) TaxID=1353009 RepID=A0A1Y2I9H7_TRAC3|nr:hypothetical protein PYCCODRAFT_1105276 [Trametes coccinea BRFM310]